MKRKCRTLFSENNSNYWEDRELFLIDWIWDLADLIMLIIWLFWSSVKFSDPIICFKDLFWPWLACIWDCTWACWAGVKILFTWAIAARRIGLICCCCWEVRLLFLSADCWTVDWAVSAKAGALKALITTSERASAKQGRTLFIRLKVEERGDTGENCGNISLVFPSLCNFKDSG